MRLRVELSGMHCDACIKAVQTALQKLEGVRNCAVRLGEVEVEYEESTLSRQQLFAAVRAAGGFDILSFRPES